MDSLAFLDRLAAAKLQPIYVLFGDERFLKRRVLDALRPKVLGDEGDSGATVFPGDRAVFAAVVDELATLPFFSARRLVIVEDADPFVSRERPKLEKYFAAPSATGVLALDVQTWPSNTRLAKALTDSATVSCKAPTESKLPDWCVKWCAARHGKQLVVPAARLLVDLIGPEMGQLDQELEKLAVYVGDAKRIDAADVDLLVGAGRAEKVFEIFDFIGDGQAGKALTMLDRLFDQGEDPHRLLGAFSMQLRRLAQAGQLTAQGSSLPAALDVVGVPPFARGGVEKQMRWLGRRRLNRIYEWLMQTQLGLRGSSALPERTAVERLVVNLARPLAAKT